MAYIETIAVISLFGIIFVLFGLAWILVEMPGMVYKKFQEMREHEAAEAEKEAALKKLQEFEHMDFAAFEAWRKSQNGSKPSASKKPGIFGDGKDGDSDSWY